VDHSSCLRYSRRRYLLHFPLILPQVQEAQGLVVTTNSGGCEEEWFLEHHLKKTRKSDAITSDAETSGGEASSKEGLRRHKESKLTPFVLCSRTVLRANYLNILIRAVTSILRAIAFSRLLPLYSSCNRTSPLWVFKLQGRCCQNGGLGQGRIDLEA